MIFYCLTKSSVVSVSQRRRFLSGKDYTTRTETLPNSHYFNVAHLPMKESRSTVHVCNIFSPHKIRKMSQNWVYWNKQMRAISEIIKMLVK